MRIFRSLASSLLSAAVAMALVPSVSPPAFAVGSSSLSVVGGAATPDQLDSKLTDVTTHRQVTRRQPDVGDKPPFLNASEWDSYVRKMRGLPYNKSLYNSAKRKFVKRAKIDGKRNAQKRANDKKDGNHPDKNEYVVKARWDGKEIVTFVVVVVGILVTGATFTGAGFVFAVLQPKNI